MARRRLTSRRGQDDDQQGGIRPGSALARPRTRARSRPGLTSQESVVMTLPTYTEATIRAQTSTESFQRGQDYYRRGAVASLVQRDETLEADVWGSDADPYRV